MAAASAVAWALRRSVSSMPPSRLTARTPMSATSDTTTRTRAIPRRRLRAAMDLMSMIDPPRHGEIQPRGFEFGCLRLRFRLHGVSRLPSYQLRRPADELLGAERP